MTVQRERFSSRVDSELLAALRELAREEGRPFSVVLEDVMRDYIVARRERPSGLDEWWPPHPTARLLEGLSLRREDMYDERVKLSAPTTSQPSDVEAQPLHLGELPC